MTDPVPSNAFAHGRDLGAELAALNDQLRELSHREANRLAQILTDNPTLSPAEHAELRAEISRFRQVAATELS